MQESESTMIACRSPSESSPPSMATPFGIGYGPGSLSSSYWKSTGEVACEESTTVIGIPTGPPSQSPDPKSAGTGSRAPIDRTIFREFERTGSLPTGLFQTFVPGKRGQVGASGSGRGAAVAGAPGKNAAAINANNLTFCF